MSWLSVITVVKDDPTGLQKSMSSLETQDLEDVEWVVVDSSTDTAEVPALLESAPAGVRVLYSYEPPQGIYAAMNAGLDSANGRYAYFLNAGDSLFDANVLAHVRQSLQCDPIWAHGPVAIRDADGSTVFTPPWDFEFERERAFARGHFPAHQGTFAQVAALKAAGGFDTTFRIAADYAMFLKLAQRSAPVVLSFVIATFESGGVSTEKWQESFREFHRARREILRPEGRLALREKWETIRQFSLVFAHREVRSRLSWLSKPLK